MVTARREEKKNSCRFQYSILNWRQKKKIRCQTTNNREEEEEEVGEEEIPMHTKKNCLKAEELLNLEEQRDTREGGVEEGRR